MADLSDPRKFRGKIAELLADVAQPKAFGDERDAITRPSIWEPGSGAWNQLVPGSADRGAPSVPEGAGLNAEIPDRSVDPQMLQWMQLGMPVKKGI